MKTKQELLDELKLELLEIGGVDNWQSYGDAIQEFKEENGFGDDEHLNSKDTLVALESGGVDNWLKAQQASWNPLNNLANIIGNPIILGKSSGSSKSKGFGTSGSIWG